MEPDVNNVPMDTLETQTAGTVWSDLARNATVMDTQKNAILTHECLGGVERLLEVFVVGVSTTQKAGTVRCVSMASIKTQPNRSQTRRSVLHVIANLMVHGMVENVTVEQLKEKMEKKGLLQENVTARLMLEVLDVIIVAQDTGTSLLKTQMVASHATVIWMVLTITSVT